MTKAERKRSQDWLDAGAKFEVWADIPEPMQETVARHIEENIVLMITEDADYRGAAALLYLIMETDKTVTEILEGTSGNAKAVLDEIHENIHVPEDE